MKLYVLPPSPRAFKVTALKNHLGLDCETQIVDLGKGDQLTPEYVAMNPNRKMPVLEDDGFVLWESNAILFYLASKKPQSGLWPSDLNRQADVLRWLAWERSRRCKLTWVWSDPLARLGYGGSARGISPSPTRDNTQRGGDRQYRQNKTWTIPVAAKYISAHIAQTPTTEIMKPRPVAIRAEELRTQP
jgi:glutathione S-transferase